jgi:hypothetical protein
MTLFFELSELRTAPPLQTPGARTVADLSTMQERRFDPHAISNAITRIKDDIGPGLQSFADLCKCGIALADLDLRPLAERSSFAS